MQARGVADLAAYREAVGDVWLEVAGPAGPAEVASAPADVAKAESILVERTAEPGDPGAAVRDPGRSRGRGRPAAGRAAPVPAQPERLRR